MSNGPRLLPRDTPATMRFVVIFGTIVSGTIALAVIATAIVISVYYGPGAETPTVLENWGGVIIGFYFGSFVTLISEWALGKPPPSPDHGASFPGPGDPGAVKPDRAPETAAAEPGPAPGGTGDGGEAVRT